MKYLISYVLPMLAGLSQAAWAQDTERQGSASDPEDAVTQPEGGVLDLTLRDNSNMDAFDLERCDEEIDAASGFDKEKWEKIMPNERRGSSRWKLPVKA